jgi:hypothetical protein
MVDKSEFNMRKMELVNLYKEYANQLEFFAVDDLTNFRKLDRLSNLHHKAMECQAEFTQYISERINEITK